jgi:hypothetical protein
LLKGLAKNGLSIKELAKSGLLLKGLANVHTKQAGNQAG